MEVVRNDAYGKWLSFSCQSMNYEVLLRMPDSDGWAKGPGYIRGSRELTAALIAERC